MKLFRAVLSAVFEALLNRIEDLKDIETIRAREHGPRVAVTIDEL